MNSLHSAAFEPECFETARDLSQRGKYRMATMKLDTSSLRISLESTLPVEASHEDILFELSKLTEPRFVIFNFNYTTPDAGSRSKTVFLLWIPHGSPLKHRTVYAASKGPVRTKLEGISFEIQGYTVADVTREEIEEKCKRIYH